MEDDAEFRESLSDLAREFGYDVASARDGAEGLHLARARRPRLVLLDLAMPIVDGWAFCREVAGTIGLFDVPIAIMSGTEPASLPPRVNDAGFFAKPLDVRRLVALLDENCGSGRPTPERAPAPRPVSARPVTPRGATVLIVEDDVDLGDTLASIVASDGYEVALARDGRDALRRLAAGLRPTVILIDLELPVMNGWALCDALALDPRLAELPVILMSASGGPRELPSPRGLVHFLAKPFTFSELLDALEKGRAPAPPSS